MSPVASRTRGVASGLARLGLDEGQETVLRRAGLWTDEPNWTALEALSASPALQRSIAALDRLSDSRRDEVRALLRDDEALRRIGVVTGVSDAFAGLLAQDVALLPILLGDLAAHSREEAAAEVRAALREADDPSTGLARGQRRGLLRIAARDLLDLASFEDVLAELSDLADAVLEVGLDVACAQVGVDVPLLVVAMGKLGGGELNYVSDVDVVFVADDARAAGRVATTLLRLVGGSSPIGRAYELDANLRPEGRDGPLVRSLDAYRSYYERWAATWEFQALLKARPVAGGADLGQEFAAFVETTVWPERRAPGAVAELQQLKTVVEESSDVRRAGGREVKLAPGGLRDIEFSVQLLQLVHGRHDPMLRVRGTLPALRALADGGYVDDDDADMFGDAYRLLRRVEHGLQLRALRRTHQLPEEVEARTRLARSLGYTDDVEAPALERFDDELRRVRADVRTLHEKLYYRPLLGRFAEVGASGTVAADAGGRFDEDEARERLGALGFADPRTATRALHDLAGGLSRRARTLRTVLPAMLPALSASPDPDGGLAALRSLADRLESSPTFLATVRDHPPVAELLATVLGRSPLVGRWLEREPEVLALLRDDAALGVRREVEDFRRLTDGLLRRGLDPDAMADAVRRLARREQARTAIRALAGFADPADVAVELSGLAEACLDAAVTVCTPPDVRLAAVGLGKLGGGELSFGADLDVMLVFEPADVRPQALDAAERLVAFLSGPTREGRAYELDLALRPEGRDGPLVRSLQSYRTYYERWADAWEFQALTQVRPVAGDRATGRAFVDVLGDLVYPGQMPEGRLDALRRVKQRVESERRGPVVPRRGGPRPVDLKLDAGGMIDVEWTLQLLQLVHAPTHPKMRRRGTFAALQAAEEEGVLGGADVATLREGYTLLVALRQALYLSGLRRRNLLPTDDREVARVAHLLGREPDAGALRGEVAERMGAMRAIHERVFADPGA